MSRTLRLSSGAGSNWASATAKRAASQPSASPGFGWAQREQRFAGLAFVFGFRVELDQRVHQPCGHRNVGTPGQLAKQHVEGLAFVLGFRVELDQRGH
jgi:hypothetical protein